MSTIKTTNIQHPSAASPAITLDSAGNLLMPGGKILQVVRATDSTLRSTTSTSFVDASLSVTITPTASDSVIYVWALVSTQAPSSGYMYLQVTDSSNNPINGAESVVIGDATNTVRDAPVVLAYATPATTSATTYKLRYRASAGTASIYNSQNTGQMIAMEVSA